jgi:hypothetical protein
MRNSLSSVFGAALLGAFAVGLVGPRSAQAQKVDLNLNGMSDIWETIYGAAALDPSGDADADGVSNLLESIAGTDPFDSASAPRIIAATSGTNLVITIPGARGKQYRLQSIQPAGAAPWTNWTDEASLVLRNGNQATFTSPLTTNATFFRIDISDVDTDNDGVNDWEEYKLGLDPINPLSNGQLDGAGAPLNDYAYVTGKLASQNVVTISATDPTANQPDTGQTAINLGVLTVSRGGFPLNPLSVNFDLGGPGVGVAVEGVDFAPIPRSLALPIGASAQAITITPLANTNRLLPVVATVQLQSGSGYSLGGARAASVVIYPSATPAGTGLTGQYYTNSSATYSSSANFNPANLKLTNVNPVVDFNWSNNPALPITNGGYYSIRWTGQIQPEYSETYYFDASIDDGVKLWVNDQLIIDAWVAHGAAEPIGSIALQAGVRYNIRMDYFNGGGAGLAHLFWYSPSQPKQIIPALRLYPVAAGTGPSAITSPLSAIAFLGQPFTFTVTGANTPVGYTATGLPPGLLFNSSNGVISGTPNLAGAFQVSLTSSNAYGVGASVLNLQVIDTGSSVFREVWMGVTGTNIADIPLDSPPSTSGTLGSLEGITGFGQDYGERIRGYFTAPATGNYYFWISGSDSAELWISNDGEAVNKVRRAYVSPQTSTTPRQWSLQPSQRSAWLALVAGQPYYLEILHKAGPGSGDNWAVGWLQDATGTNDNPAGVVPGYLLSRFFPLPPSNIPGTLYAANLLAQANALSTGVGSATLRLSADGSQAVLSFSYGSLTTPVTGEHIHCDPYLASPSQIMFDIDAATPQADGTYLWNLVPVGTLSVADIREIIREGKAYLNIHTTRYPAGEINGHFTLANGTQTFTPPPAPLTWTDDHANASAAARFLIQATFGPSPSEIAAVQSLGYAGWIDNQLSLPPTHHLPYVLNNVNSDPTTPYPTSRTFNSWWQQSLTAPDQLRQRVAFALSEIMVTSGAGALNNNARALSSYYDTLLDNSLSNFRDLLKSVTLSPTMGIFLDMRGNSKGSMITGLHPNENYAREILQLFSVGLNRMWPDGTLVMDSRANLVPTYNQSVIMGFASVFTGWNYYQTNQANGRLPTSFNPSPNYTNAMVLVPAYHELGTKLLLDNVVLPQAWGSQADSASTNFDIYCSLDLEKALDSIFANQNVGPFICRQLIQRLVASNPSRDYVYRVVQKFNDNGFGVRGDLAAVIRAILLDYEARSSAVAAQSTFGKQREPLLRATATARAFPPPPPSGGTYSENGLRSITVSTTNAHRLNTGDTVFLNFADTSGQPAPGSLGYSVTVTAPTAFTVNAPGMLTGTYTQTPSTTISNMLTASTDVTNVIYVNLGTHDLLVGNPVYLAFTSGGASNGVYQVVWMTNNNFFAVVSADTNTLSGNMLVSKVTGAGYTQRGTTITLGLPVPHNLLPGDPVYINFTSGTAADGTYNVASVVDATHFIVPTSNSATQTVNGATVYSLAPPPLVRSGTIAVQQSTWSVGATDSTLTQTPLNAPTVFNFFFPDYKFPGPLAAAGLTTPEFQLTSDTDVAVQMNFLEGGLLNNTVNTNGLSSFIAGAGAIVLDLGPWMTPAYTSNSGIPGLVDALNTLLIGGTLSPAARTVIINYVANTGNYPYTTPSFTEMRERVRAVVHLLVTSPDFTVQR